MESIAILTGGGPAPGMNTVVGSVAKTFFLQKGFRVIGLHGGYSGLFNKNLKRLTSISCWPTIFSTAAARCLTMSRFKTDRQEFRRGF